MRSLNKAMIIGRLGKDPDLKYLQSGQAVAKFSVATDDSWTDKASGEKKSSTEWHNIVAWGKLAEICGEHLHKGSLVYVEGKIQTRSYEDQNGTKRYITEISISDLQMLDSKGAGSQSQEAGHPATSSSDKPLITDDDVPF